MRDSSSNQGNYPIRNSDRLFFNNMLYLRYLSRVPGTTFEYQIT